MEMIQEIIKFHLKNKDVLGFKPKYSIKNGIKELIEALDLGLYSDIKKNINKYGNYYINY